MEIELKPKRQAGLIIFTVVALLVVVLALCLLFQRDTIQAEWTAWLQQEDGSAYAVPVSIDITAERNFIKAGRLIYSGRLLIDDAEYRLHSQDFLLVYMPEHGIGSFNFINIKQGATSFQNSGTLYALDDFSSLVLEFDAGDILIAPANDAITAASIYEKIPK